jgi:type IV pilus assembly protein PilB
MGECLVQAGLITDDSLRVALAEQKRTGERLGIVLTRLNLATETGIAQALASQLGFPYCDLAVRPPEPGVIGVIPRATALKHAAVAVSLEQQVLTVAMSDPLMFGLVQDLERRTGYTVRQVVATRSGILGAIVGADNRVARRVALDAHADAGVGRPSLALPRAKPESGELLQSILSSAVASGASDVHIEPTGQSVVVRERVDGALREAMQLPTWAHDELMAHLKRLAGMQASETRLPQDGRLRHVAGNGSAIDFRVSSLRTLFGEKVVLRRWDRQGVVPSLDDLGLSKAMLERVRQFMANAHGLVLVVGPAGSGVQTTMAALAAELVSVRAGRDDIVTVEDPIEYQIPGVTQVSVDGANGEIFASRLQSVLRQQPDVVCVGELRETETTQVALSAAARALVVTTFRADDLPSTITGLLALGIDAAAIAAPLVGVVVQRLVRRLCVSCRRPRRAGLLHPTRAGDEPPGPVSFFEPVGCDQCHHTGYRGRIGVYQAIAVSAAVRQAIADAGPAHRLGEAVRQDGGVSLAEDALAKAKRGVTTVDEVLRAVGEGRVHEIDSARPLCEACGAAVGEGFLACPSCGATIGSACLHCGRALQSGWQFCPYCARRAEPPDGGREGNRRRARTVLS